MGRASKLTAGFIALSLGVAANSLFGAALAPNPAPNPSVPVETLRGYLMVVSVTLNDCGPFKFLVDTGTNTTLIDPALADELKLKPVGRMTLGSMGKSAPVFRYFLEGFRVGEASVSHLEALALPLPQLRALDRKIRGVLGMNFLLHFSFLLDYEQQRLQIFPIPELARAPEGARIRPEINDWRLLIPVASQASPRGLWKLTLDSGISGVLVLENRVNWSAKGLDRCAQAQAGCMMEVSGNLSNQTARAVRLHEMSIAGAAMRDVPVVVLRDHQAKPSDPSDGLLPTSLFGSVFFDRTNATLVLSPRLAMVAGR
jgi:predicted aspartyl protease